MTHTETSRCCALGCRWLGVDFSGDHQQWRAGRTKSNVWIADVRQEGSEKVLCSLIRVQELASDDETPPFVRLVELLRSGEYDAAAIDAPFSVPRQFVTDGSHSALLARVGAIELTDKRPFPNGSAFVKAIAGQDPPLNPPKPLRRTERFWLSTGVNVRSTLWAGARGGAAMTAACITLLHLAGRPIWPWREPAAPGLLVEAFPAAQLRHWGLPHQAYSGNSPEAAAVRDQILTAVGQRLDLPERIVAAAAGCADALDAILCAFAAIAVTVEKVAHRFEPTSEMEGWIAVHD